MHYGIPPQTDAHLRVPDLEPELQVHDGVQRGRLSLVAF